MNIIDVLLRNSIRDHINKQRGKVNLTKPTLAHKNVRYLLEKGKNTLKLFYTESPLILYSAASLNYDVESKSAKFRQISLF